MSYDCLLFDLDGTLSDPKAGILSSTNYALAETGYPPIPANAIDAYIGPPLDFAFKQITGTRDEGHIQDLIVKYREAYSLTGYAENTLYPGVAGLLEQLSQKKVRMGVCTSKRADFAESILELHHIRHHFEFVSGGDVGVPKWQQIHELLKSRVISREAVMIGDRNVDLEAAWRNDLDSAGVLWGYGSWQELMGENPTHLFKEPGELVVLSP